LQKGRYDPWLIRGAIDVFYFSLALPVALFVVPWPEAHVWPLLGGVIVIQFAYKVVQALSYERGAFTVVYPIVRGTGPLVTVAAASLVFGESYTLTQWLGVLLLSGGILMFAAINYSGEVDDRRRMMQAMGFALVTGFFVALYTTYNAYGIRQTPDPFTFLAWFFVVDGLIFPWISLARWRGMAEAPALLPLLGRGLFGALVAYCSFGSVMLATRIDKVGQAAVLRETSVVFAALIGWLFLGERVGWARAGLVILIALGAVVVEFGGR
jgi:drug/metabolite transporter (DMT)-like permease